MRTAEQGFHTVVPLVARVFVDWTRKATHRDRRRPGARVSYRVGHSVFVLDRILSDPSAPLNHHQFAGRSRTAVEWALSI